jgi:hypothetical protein
MKIKSTFFILSLFSAITLFSCSKDETCNCGTIANDGIDGNCYWLEIRNECSGNKKKFCFDQDVWSSNYVGNRFCVTNQNSW